MFSSRSIDYAFKQILGNPDHTGITVHFLNAILNLEPRITSVQIRNPILDKDFEDDRLKLKLTP